MNLGFMSVFGVKVIKVPSKKQALWFFAIGRQVDPVQR